MDSPEMRLAASALTTLSMLRQTMRQRALFDSDGTGTPADDLPRIGSTLARLDSAMRDLRVHFDLDPDDIDLGDSSPAEPVRS